MKIKTKIIAAAVTAIPILSAIAINSKIFRSAEKKLTSSKSDFNLSEHIYNWKFGNISYKTIGSGEPVLLVHSLLPGTTDSEWEKNISSLSKNNKLYLINLLGYGNSDRTGITYSSYLFVCLINDFITEVIKEPAAVIASNTSASISAMAYIFNTNNFKKLCLICPHVTPNKFSASRSLKKFPLDFPVLGDLFFNYHNSKSRLKTYLENNIYSSSSYVTDKKINNLYGYAHKGWGNNRHLFSSFITNKFEIGIETSLPETDIETLIIYGSDFPDLEKNISAIIELNNKAKTEVLKGKAFPNEEDSEKFNNLLSNFLKSQ